MRERGVTAAITALIGGFIALLGAVTRRAFTNDAMLVRLERELLAERDRVDRQRAEDRKGDADRLERIETDIRAMRNLMFEAFQRGHTDWPVAPSPSHPTRPLQAGFACLETHHANHHLCPLPRRARL